jgi:xanthine dehydrogenase YagS FAD-binding subunit
MRPFQHYDATTVEAVTGFLSEQNGRAVPIAGGTDLLGVLKDSILPHHPEAVVNLKTIPGLDAVREEDGGLFIGAMVRLADLSVDPVIREKYPVLAESAETVATPVIRKMATIGGNLCQDVRCWYYRYPHSLGGRIDCFRKGGKKCPAVPGDNRYHSVMKGKICFAVCPSDTAVALSALEAEIFVQGPAGRRTVSIGNFYTATGHILEPGEIVTGIRIPEPLSGSRQTFIKFTLRKPIDFALVSVASVLIVEDGTCIQTRISLGAVAPMPVRAEKAEAFLTGKVIDEASAREAAEIAMAAAKPLSRNGYKVDIAKSLITRTVLSVI